jgi:phytoene synthase
MSATHDAFLGQLDKLLQARPEHAIARLFVPADRRDAFSAFECLVFELEQTVWHAREAQAALAKLQWWGEELQRSVEGAARHPITQHLPSVRDAAAAKTAAVQAISAVMDFLDAGSLGDFTAQQTALARFYSPLAQSQQQYSGDGGGASLRALSFLLRELGRLSCGDAVHPMVIPLNLLARHQLSRDALTQAGAPREALLRDQLQALSNALSTHALLPDAGFAVRLRQRLDRRLAKRAAAASTPSQAMRAAVGVPAATAWYAWREARRGV